MQMEDDVHAPYCIELDSNVGIEIASDDEMEGEQEEHEIEPNKDEKVEDE